MDPDRRMVAWIAGLVLAVALLPQLVGCTLAEGRYYTGFDFNSDDMCVYTAWMEQARRGHFFFDDRFTTDPQPRQTVHLLFFVLGTVARFTGLSNPIVFHAARIVFGFLFIFASWRLIRRVIKEKFPRRIALGVLLVSGGIGWIWAAARLTDPLAPGMIGPSDIWQAEGFTFPSLLTNTLFVAALWLMLEAWLAILDARDGWRSAPRGFVAMLVLANIHTYDALTMTLVAVTFAACCWGSGILTVRWLLRGAVILAGAIPSAAWLWHVRAVDPVFAARADTLTFSPDPWQYFLGYLPLLILAGVWLWFELRGRVKGVWQALAWLPAVVLVAVCAARGWLNTEPSAEKALVFGVIYAALTVGAVALTRHLHGPKQERPGPALAIAWGAVALWIPYFPALFQRKLTMGAHIPLALLGGLGLALLLAKHRRPGHESRMLAFAALTFLALTNLFWLTSGVTRTVRDEASTKIHPVFLSQDQYQALEWLRDKAPEDAAVLELTPYACFIPAIAGQRTFAGHWSETPEFGEKFAFVNRNLYNWDGHSRLAPAERLGLVKDLEFDYVVWHKAPEGEPFTDLSSLGPAVFDSPTVALVSPPQ